MKVIYRKRLPARPPMLTTAVLWLLADRLHWPEWAWTLAGVYLALAWIISMICVVNEEPVDPFGDGK